MTGSRGALAIAAVISATALLIWSAPISAQDSQPQNTSKPESTAPAYPTPDSPTQNPNGEQNSASPLQGDDRPLTGVQDPTLGSLKMGHSYWIPGLQYFNIVRSTALNESAASGWNSTSYIVGNLSLYRVSNNSQLSVNYSGGGYFSTDPAQGNGYFQQFGLAQTFKWRRWQLALLDQFSYLPESAFGFGIGTGLAIPGIGGSLGSGLPGLGVNYQPNQSILTSAGPRYSNSFAAQVVYALSSRASINLSGSYGLLRFVEAGNIDTDDAILSAGYNYALSRADTIGVIYRFSEYRYLGNPQALNDHSVHVAYGRKVTGRLALRLFGGPEVTTFRVPVGGKTQQVAPSGGATLDYAWSENNSLYFTYNHGLGNGSGVQIGSNSDQVRLGLERRISRHWHGNIAVGYARNRGLGNILVVTQNAGTFDSYYFGGGLGRPLGHNSTLSLAYSALIQSSNQAVCAAGNCNTSYLEHQLTVGLSWHARPFVFR
jgi:hypothetical protein